MTRSRAAEAVAFLRSQGSETFRAGLARYGLPTGKAFGVPVGTIQKYGRTLGRDHGLAQALWQTGWTDARMLAAFVGEPGKVTAREMDAWCRDFDSWGIVDTVCFKLWDRSPLAWTRAVQWTARKSVIATRSYTLRRSRRRTRWRNQMKAAQRWVGKDALRDLERAVVKRKVTGRK